MRILSFLLVISILTSCTTEDVIFFDGNWTRIIYETSDIGAIEINRESNPTIAFRSNFYEILGVDGTLSPTRKESLSQFHQSAGQVASPLGIDSKFVFGMVDSSGFVPEYGIKLMDNEFEAFSYSHGNFEKGIFLPGSPDTFYGLLQSPVYQGGSGKFDADILIVEYTTTLGALDTLSSHRITVTDLLLDQSSIFDGFIDGDHIYLAIQSQIYRYNTQNQNIVSINTGSYIQNIFPVGDQVVVRKEGFKLEIHSQELVLQNDLDLSDILTGGEDIKNTILKMFTKGDQVFLITGVSQVKEIRHDFLAEVTISVDLLTIDNSWNVTGNHTILKGLDGDTELLWKKYKLISEDVREGFFAVFLFQSSLADSKYEYLVKRVNLN